MYEYIKIRILILLATTTQDNNIDKELLEYIFSIYKPEWIPKFDEKGNICELELDNNSTSERIFEVINNLKLLPLIEKETFFLNCITVFNRSQNKSLENISLINSTFSFFLIDDENKNDYPNIYKKFSLNNEFNEFINNVHNILKNDSHDFKHFNDYALNKTEEIYSNNPMINRQILLSNKILNAFHDKYTKVSSLLKKTFFIVSTNHLINAWAIANKNEGKEIIVIQLGIISQIGFFSTFIANFFFKTEFVKEIHSSTIIELMDNFKEYFFNFDNCFNSFNYGADKFLNYEKNDIDILICDDFHRTILLFVIFHEIGHCYLNRGDYINNEIIEKTTNNLNPKYSVKLEEQTESYQSEYKSDLFSFIYLNVLSQHELLYKNKNDSGLNVKNSISLAPYFFFLSQFYNKNSIKEEYLEHPSFFNRLVFLIQNSKKINPCYKLSFSILTKAINLLKYSIKYFSISGKEILISELDELLTIINYYENN